MNKKEKQQIKYLLENLKWYSEAPNEQDYNGEYEPPMEWEQGEAKIFLKYLEEQDKEIERLNKKYDNLYNTYLSLIEILGHQLSFEIPKPKVTKEDFDKLCEHIGSEKE